jgi:hypothetical protein
MDSIRIEDHHYVIDNDDWWKKLPVENPDVTGLSVTSESINCDNQL